MTVNRYIVGPIDANCYLAESAREAIIIDPGGSSKELMNEIKDRGLRVDYIINTHYHFDHTDANREIKAATGAALLIHESEKDYIDFLPDKLIKDGDGIKFGEAALEVLSTPGHTKGSICLFGEDLVFTGDTLFKDGRGRTDLPGGDEAAMQRSLEMLRKKIRPAMMIYPGHGEPFRSG